MWEPPPAAATGWFWPGSHLPWEWQAAAASLSGNLALPARSRPAMANFLGAGRIEASNGSLGNPGGHLGQFNPGDTGYVGLEDAGNFGWAKIEVLSGYQAKLLGFAYNTQAGAPIQPAD